MCRCREFVHGTPPNLTLLWGSLLPKDPHKKLRPGTPSVALAALFDKRPAPVWQVPHGISTKINAESDSEQRRQEKTTKTASGAVSGHIFRPRIVFFLDFWIQKPPKTKAKPVPKSNFWNLFYDAFFECFFECDFH